MLKPGLRWGLVAATLLVLLLAGYLAWERYYGIGVVERLCASDGGVAIFDTAYSNGFLTYDTSDTCCFEELQRGDFAYLDIDLTQSSSVVFSGLPPGYYRFTLAELNDPRCDVWKRYSLYTLRAKTAGLPADRCVAVEALPGRPRGFAYSDRWTTVLGKYRTKLRLHEFTMSDTESGQVLARVRDYQFTSKLSSWPDMSDHGGNADAKCISTLDYSRTVRGLPSRVLRNPAKKTD